MMDISRLAAELLLAMQTALGQPMLDPPRTLAVDAQFLEKRACAHIKTRCKVLAWYSPEGTIYIDDALDINGNPFAQSILVHELTHHVQRMRSGKDAENCQEWQAREREAYNVQRFWLAQKGLNANTLFGPVHFLRCADD